ncbi:DNA polymerase epsilon subunit 3 [Homalodisca vitripennis]|uniref:DNA polymerase epsilon subunit 3 n=1 Tax=Homalodisca vitripennis TaxID=197043 RepID=UPI001EEC8B4F|nr:DNA polymerase epsilon subunit 3 [Homalodisca vitripennis]
MAEKLEDLNLPISVVARLVKEGLPDGVIVSKEAKTAVARAASVFVLYITSTANTIAMRNKRKTINSDDVFQAVIDTEYQWLQEPLKESFEDFKKLQRQKKESAARKRMSKDRRTEYDDEDEDS